jgi:tetratricopeptide (TPR) repeat protein
MAVVVGLVLLLVVVVAPSRGWGQSPAAELPSSEAMAAVEAALARGAFTEAIDQLELWSDQGKAHADLSFDRGLAYLGRAESSAQQRSDLAQAVAGFEEALLLDPSDDEAQVAVERVREALSRRRAERQDRGIVARPRLLRAVLSLVGENVWAILGGVGSLLLGIGLSLRLFRQSEVGRVTSGVLAIGGLVCALTGGGLAAAGRTARKDFFRAVVVTDAARLLDGSGRPAVSDKGPSTRSEMGDRVPEGSLVYVAETRGALVRAEWGDTEAWITQAQIRRLAAP